MPESDPQGVSTTVTATVPGDPEDVFDTIVPVDLSRVFSRWGPVPGVERTEILRGDGSWDEEGMRRRVVLADGSSVEEEVVAVEEPWYFAYELRRFEFAPRYLVDGARGEWVFVPVGDGTLVKWTYSFEPRNRALTPVVSLFANYVYRNYMRSAMTSATALVG